MLVECKVEVMWFKDDYVFKEDYYIIIIFVGEMYVVNIFNVIVKDEVVYCCVVINGVGLVFIDCEVFVEGMRKLFLIFFFLGIK